jgi:hypothetical protein
MATRSGLVRFCHGLGIGHFHRESYLCFGDTLVSTSTKTQAGHTMPSGSYWAFA